MSNFVAYKSVLNQFKSVFSIFFFHYWFFINVQMSAEWNFFFVNSTIIILCLIYSLNIPHSNQNPWSFCCFLSSLSSHLATFWRMVNGEVVTRKWVWHFFSCDFTIATGDRLVSGLDDKYKIHSFFIVSRLSS